MSAARPLISKSAYLQGIQCLKLAWFRFNAREEIPAPEDQAQATFAQGEQVGALARSLFSNGVDAAARRNGFDGVTPLTTELLRQRVPLFEAELVYNCNSARADILEPVEEDFWDIVEVKSSTDVKDVYLRDLAFQKFVYSGVGLKIRRCFVLHINNAYVRNGHVDARQLFTRVDVTDRVERLVGAVQADVDKIRQAIALPQYPATEIGKHCDSPYTCPLHDTCWAFLPEHNVFTLAHGGNRSLKLFTQGVHDIRGIPSDFGLSDKQAIQRSAIVTGKCHIDKKAISAFLRKLKYPLYFLDFETFATAIPLFEGIKAYQQVPFQFSLHIVRGENVEPEHASWLAEDATDRRPEFLCRLRDALGDEGSIVTYNAAFEKTRLRECAAAFPEFANWVEEIVKRFIDLWSPFKAFGFYHPNQLGSTSIKKVLPALTGASYEGLEIGDGAQASLEFLRISLGGVSFDDRAATRKNLENYCALDTLGMVKIVDQLRKLVDGRLGLGMS